MDENLSVGSELELDVCDLGAEGGSVARRDGLVFFLDRGVPGARVLARVTGVKKRLVEAEYLRDVFPSPFAIMPFCESFGLCGGCTCQDMNYQAQLQFKRQRAMQTLSRLGGIRLPLPEILPSPGVTGFRNKVEYAFGPGEGSPDAAPVLGLRRRASHEVMDLPRCPLQSQESGAILGVVRAWAARHSLSACAARAGLGGADRPVKGCLRHLVLREPLWTGPDETRQRLVELICGRHTPPRAAVAELADELAALGVTSFILSRRLSRDGLARGEEVVFSQGPASLWEDYAGLLLEFPARGFMQTNSAAATYLLELVRRHAAPRPEDRLWDLYCGSGMFGLALAPSCAGVTGVELDREAIEFADKNAARLGIPNAQFHCADVLRALEAGLEKGARADVIITDPPRRGLGRGVLEAIKTARPRRIVYVSCNPGTLARDLSGLAPEYRVCAVDLVDMFPHSPHMELVAALERC